MSPWKVASETVIGACDAFAISPHHQIRIAKSKNPSPFPVRGFEIIHGEEKQLFLADLAATYSPVP